MKKILFLLSVASLATACSSNELPEGQSKAEALVTNYLKDSSGYKALSFDTLREVQQSYIIGDPEGRRLDGLAKSYNDSALSERRKGDEAIINSKTVDTILVKKHQDLDASYLKKSDSISNIIIKNSKDYKAQSFQYTILHTYDIKDDLGHNVKHTTNFWLDRDLTKVLQQQEAN